MVLTKVVIVFFSKIEIVSLVIVWCGMIEVTNNGGLSGCLKDKTVNLAIFCMSTHVI
jgi:hypothetical protein